MVARNRARYLAPIALAATLTATFVVVRAALNETHAATRPHHVTRAGRGRFAKATNYTVQSGDSLSTISARTGIPVATLEALNPSVDPNNLQTGQRLRLRR